MNNHLAQSLDIIDAQFTAHPANPAICSAVAPPAHSRPWLPGEGGRPSPTLFTLPEALLFVHRAQHQPRALGSAASRIPVVGIPTLLDCF